MILNTVLKWIGLIVLAVIFIIVRMFIYGLLRPNRSSTHLSLHFETCNAIKDGRHNAYVDMIQCKGYYYPGPIDGVAGRFTYSAIDKFQTKSGIPVDTTIDEELLSILKKKVNADNGI